MINKMIEFSVKNNYLVFAFSVMLILIGYKSFQDLPIDAVPDITNTQVQINTPVSGFVPNEIERMISFPIESSMNGIKGVQTIRSISRYGISQVTVIFNDNTDILTARQLVSEKLGQIDLPEGVKPEMGPISTGLGEIFHYTIGAKSVDETINEEEKLELLMELRALQDWFIKPRLLSVKGVTEVNTIGGFERQYYIQPNMIEMTKYGIHFDDIEKSIEETNINAGGGYISQTGEQILVRGVGLLKNFEDIENVVIKRLGNYKVIRVKDIATVKFDKELRTGAATVNGKESIIGTAFMLLGENSRSVSMDVAAKLKEIEKELPDWVKLEVLYDRSIMVDKTLGTVEHNLLMGAGLVMLFLLLLVGNLRAAMITAIIIPISLLMTFILMKWQNVSGNLMSLGALDFGIIVDGAVIVIESCVHQLQKEGKRAGRELTRIEVKEIVTNAAIEIRSAAGFGEIIVMIVFIPLFALTGIEGKMFGPMATTFIMALASALFLSFTLVPALAGTFLSGKTKDKEPLLMKLMGRVYRPILDVSLKFKRFIFVTALIMIALGGYLFSGLGAEFIPKLDEGDLAVQFIRPTNISAESSVKLQMISEKLILEFPQVKTVFARTGAAEVATDPMGMNISDSYVMLHPISDWPKDESITTKDELSFAIKEKLEEGIPGQVTLFSQPVELRFNELLEGVRGDVSVKIFGSDHDEIMKYAKEIAEVIKDIEGSGEVEVESKSKSPLLQYNPKMKELSELGVTARPVLDAIDIAIGGKAIGYIFDNVKKYPIVIRLSEEERLNMDTIKKLPVGISQGYTLPIEELADIEFIETANTISRENSEPRVAIVINPDVKDIESFVLKAQKLVEEKIKLPSGYFIEWGGSFKNLNSAKERLLVLTPIALLLILVLLFTAFKNVSQVLLIFTCAPMALLGGVLSLIIMDMPFSISAGVGFIALTGISILNGVVLVSYFNQLSLKGLSPDDIVKQGSLIRLRPVLMTALTDIFGFLPMIFSTSLGAEVQKPLAVVVVGGIFTATALTLVVLPSLYRLFYRYTKPRV